MAAYKPSTCPECGSTDIKKEYIRGYSTNDWVCGSCGDCGPMQDEPFPSKHSVNQPKPNKEINEN